MTQNPSQDLSGFLGHDRFATVMADPPWRFVNRTGKVAPEYPGTAPNPRGIHCDVPMPHEPNGEGR